MKKVLMIYEDFAEGARTQNFLKKIGFDVVSQANMNRLSDQILTLNPDLIVGNGIKKFSSIDVGFKLREIAHFRGKSLIILPNGVRPDPKDLVRAKIDVLLESPVSPEKLIQVISKMLKIEVAPLLAKFKKAKLTDPSLDQDKFFAMGGEANQENDSIHVKSSQDKDEDSIQLKGDSEVSNDEIRISQHQENEGGLGEPTEKIPGVDFPDIPEQIRDELSGNERSSRQGLLKQELEKYKTQLDHLKISDEESSFKKVSEKVSIQDKERAQGYQKFLNGLKIDKKQTTHTRQGIKARQAELKKDWDSHLLEDLDKLKRQFVEALFKKK